MKIKKINPATVPRTPAELLAYEISNSWIAPFVSSEWLGELLADFYVWKLHRKLSRYQAFLNSGAAPDPQ